MELTVTLISSLEDTLEMTEEGNMPAIGACFEELGRYYSKGDSLSLNTGLGKRTLISFSLSAEAEEFDVYEKYARDILSPKSRHTLDSLLPRQIVSDALRYTHPFELNTQHASYTQTYRGRVTVKPTLYQNCVHYVVI